MELAGNTSDVSQLWGVRLWTVFTANEQPTVHLAVMLVIYWHIKTMVNTRYKWSKDMKVRNIEYSYMIRNLVLHNYVSILLSARNNAY